MALVPSNEQIGPLANNEISAPISELSSYLKRWITLQDELNALNAEVKERRTQSKALKEVILRIMSSNKVATINVSKGTVMHKIQDKCEKISNDYLLKHCKTFFEGDEEKAKSLVKYLEDNRTVIKKHDLKIKMNVSDDDKLSGRS